MDNYFKEKERLISLFEEQRNKCERVSALTDAIVKSRKKSVVFEVCSGAQCELRDDSVQVFDFVHADIRDIAGTISSYGKDNAALIVGLSKRHVGGGVIHGQKSREAQICRQSALYYCLLDDKVQEEFYGSVQGEDSSSIRCVYFPQLLIYKDPYNLSKEEALYIDVIGVDLPQAESDVAGEDVDINDYRKALESCSFMMYDYLKDLGIDTLII